MLRYRSPNRPVTAGMAVNRTMMTAISVCFHRPMGKAVIKIGPVSNVVPVMAGPRSIMTIMRFWVVVWVCLIPMVLRISGLTLF